MSTMLTAAAPVVAALAFVLGLGAVCLWALKRFGAVSLASKTRVPLEVVQRIPLGPKTGLAVVRVGERVMALSIGEGGVRQLFELDEVDRQRIIATSTLPVPMTSSAAAAASFTAPSALPTALTRAMQSAFPGPFGAMFRRSLNATVEQPSAPPVTVIPFSAAEPCEVPSFLTSGATTRRGDMLTYAPVSSPPGDRDFGGMLGISLSGATRMASFAAAMLLLGATTLRAQAAATGTTAGTTTPATTARATTAAPAQPRVAPRTATPAATTTPAAVQMQSLLGAQTTRPSLTAPTPPDAPAFPLPPKVQRAIQDAELAVGKKGANGRTSRLDAARSADNRADNRADDGADVPPREASARQRTSRMVIDSTRDTDALGNPTTRRAAPAPVAGDDAVMRMMPQMDVTMGGGADGGGLRLNGTVGVVVMMGLLTLLPTLLLMMTGFTRILIVLNFLKQAMGTQSAPPAPLVAGMALLLTGFVMTPTLTQVNREAITPWLDGTITQVEMMKTGVKPMRAFMLRQTRESDLKSFVEMSRIPRPGTVDDVPLHVLMSAFVASELRTAFQIGFAIYLPFIIIDTVVASVLMSMGMMMLPPAMISLPFKLLLFVLVDGWTLTITSLVQSFK